MKPKSPTTPAQLIKQYIETHSMNQAKFGEIADVPQGMVSYWLRGKRPVSPRAAIEIEKNTAGALSRYQLCPDVFRNDSAA